jgi:hypothetical protein
MLTRCRARRALRSRFRPLLGWVGVALLSLPGRAAAEEADGSTAAASDPKAVSVALHREAEDKLEAGDWSNACTLYQRSQELVRSAATQARIAQCLEHEGRWLKALAAWQEALQLVELLSDPARRSTVRQSIQDDLAALESRIPMLRVLAAPAAEALLVRLDEQQLSSLDLANPVRVEPGAHVLSVELPGLAPRLCLLQAEQSRKTQVRLALGSAAGPATGCLWENSTTLLITLVPLPLIPRPVAEPTASTAAAAPDKAGSAAGALGGEHAASSDGQQRIVGFATVGAGAAVLAVATYFGVRTLWLVADADCDAQNTCSKSGKATIDDARRSQTIGFVSAGIGAALVAAGITILSWPEAGSAATSQHPARSSHMAITLNPGGLSIQGRW